MINLNNGVANVKQTPAIIADILSNIPIADSVGEGTLFIDISTKQILRAESGGWVTYGTGFASDLQSVLNAGNSATDTAIELYDVPTTIRIFLTGAYIQWLETGSLNQQWLYPATSFNNQKVYLPAYDGILATTQGFYKSQITTTPFTVNGGNNQNIYRVSTGAGTLTLNPANWIDRVTVTFCFEISTGIFVAAGGATLKGNANINNSGLVYVMYLSVSNTFYISHI